MLANIVDKGIDSDDQCSVDIVRCKVRLNGDSYCVGVNDSRYQWSMHHCLHGRDWSSLHCVYIKAVGTSSWWALSAYYSITGCIHTLLKVALGHIKTTDSWMPKPTVEKLKVTTGLSWAWNEISLPTLFPLTLSGSVDLESIIISAWWWKTWA